MIFKGQKLLESFKSSFADLGCFCNSLSRSFQMALQNSSSCSDTPISYAEQRSRLYDKMSRDLDENGAAFLNRGETSQSLSLSDLFTLKDGSVTPILKAAIPPVRATVLYLSPEYSVPISEAVRSIFLPHFEKMIWFQNSTLYHFSMFHASHNITPVPATEEEIEAEVNAVKAVAEDLCPLTIVLDRVVLTSTSVLVGCWQVLSGTDPVIIRAKLRAALPRAPEKQLYDAAILHTSFARLLGHPNASSSEADKTSEIQIFHDLVTQLNNQIQGFEATVTELWYVEEFDVLALALDGKIKVRKFKFGFSKT
ncbi:hypothetical protein LOK49_LG04G01938 [Camellia lanceoleosa]|uniref:Uncharacterized protein n=1 Tax=Camellia lanceoleosa TaxID=1840588 RepID=A0ACC0HY16_9ERIC|nr:hypothetical protein LOK49_LG04G01938 [Camellia lanceoleosa]